MFLRLVVGSDSESHQKQFGIFSEVSDLRSKGLFEDYQLKLTRETFKYFNDNLPELPYSEKTGLLTLLLDLRIRPRST